MKAIFIAVFFIAPISSWAGADFARVVEVTGQAKAVINGHETQLTPGARVPAGALVETEKNSTLKLQLGDRSVLDLNPQTKMQIAANSDGIKTSVMDLDNGMIRGVVPKKADNAIYKVRTKSATMGIRGTQFVVNVSQLPSGVIKSDFYCLQGSIKIEDVSAKKLADVNAGSFLSVGATVTNQGVKIVEPPKPLPIPTTEMKNLMKEKLPPTMQDAAKPDAAAPASAGQAPVPAPAPVPKAALPNLTTSTTDQPVQILKPATTVDSVQQPLKQPAGAVNTLQPVAPPPPPIKPILQPATGTSGGTTTLVPILPGYTPKPTTTAPIINGGTIIKK
jgi:hypothetical protein